MPIASTVDRPLRPIDRHRSRGRRFEAAGVGSFVLDEGGGEPVLCLHGIPASSYVYRKVLPELAARGLRGIAFDLPGLGLADRPRDFDYSWTGLGRFASAAVDALGLDRFHLVVHDLGGPVGFELATARADRILSLTILDTPIEVDTFRPYWLLAPLAVRGVGELWLGAMTRRAFLFFLRRLGLEDPEACPDEELEVYYEHLVRPDRGRAFLAIFRGAETTPAKAALYRRAVRDVPYPVQILWSTNDPALPLEVQGRQALRATGLPALREVRARHFLQEEAPGTIAEAVATLAGLDQSTGTIGRGTYR